MSQTDICAQAAQAVLEDTALHNKIVDDLILKDSTDSAILQKIPYKGDINAWDNKDEVRYGYGMPAPVNIPEKGRHAECAEDRYQAGSMSALDQCSGKNAEFGTLVNPESTLDCDEKPHTVPTNMGFEITDHVDFYGEFESEIVCGKTLYEQGPQHIKRGNASVREIFAKWLIWNQKKHLQRQVVLRGEANSSFLGQTSLDNLTSTGGFYAPPTKTLYWDHLRLYRDYMISQGALDDTNGVLMLEGTQRDTLAAIREDQVAHYGTNAVNITPYEDNEGKMKGRKYVEYDQIRVYFNEKPRKFLIKRTGTNSCEYEEIYPWKNSSERAKAGILMEPNPDYYKSVVECGGQLCQVAIGMDHIHSESLSRYGLNPPMVHEGQNVGTQLQLAVRTGADLSHICTGNTFYDKWQYVARIAQRLQLGRTEWLGSLMYLASDYAINVREPIQNGTKTICEKPFTQAAYQDHNGKGCEECEEPCTDASAINLSQCPIAEFLWNGVDKEAAIRVKLASVPCADGTVDFEFVDDSAVFGTNFTSSLGQTGTLTIPADCQDDLLIPVTITDVPEGADPAVVNKITATLNLINATGGVELGDCVSTALCMAYNAVDCSDEGCVPVAKPDGFTPVAP